MRTFLLLLLSSIAAVTAASGADMSGVWSIDGSLNANPLSFDCTFLQTGQKLAGTCKASDLNADVTGSVKEDLVQFSFVYQFAGVPYTCTYTGKLAGGTELRGSIAVAGVDGTTGEFVAKKS